MKTNNIGGDCIEMRIHFRNMFRCVNIFYPYETDLSRLDSMIYINVTNKLNNYEFK